MTMTKIQLANRFRAKHTMHGYLLEYTNYTTTWTYYTSYASYYDELKDAQDLTYKRLTELRSLIVQLALKKTTI